MWDFSVGRALRLMLHTWPFVAFRIAVYFGIAAALVMGFGAGIGWGVGAFGGPDFQAGSSVWGGIFGFGLTAGVLYFLREYILYIVKAGHIAVLVELMEGKTIPDVKGVLRAIAGAVEGVASILPIPGLQQIVGVVRAFWSIAVGLVDEVILAHAIRTRSTNPWDSARTALVLYGRTTRQCSEMRPG